MLHSTRLGIAAAVASCLTLLWPQGAAGELTDATDPAGDVVFVEIDGGPNSENVATLRPERAHGDIRSLHANHAHTQLVAALRFRNIDATKYLSHDLVFRTPHARYLVTFTHTGGHIEGRDFFNESRGTWPRCAGLAIDIMVARDRVRVTVPRGCLNRPRWVRVGAETESGDWFYDDALRRGRNDSDWGFVGPSLGPRLSRGKLLT